MDSKLQIISGRFRGYKLNLPLGARPTQNRARIAVFNMLSGGMPSDGVRCVWDAFAGSGALGLEVLSRYDNSTAIFTDVSDVSIKTITRNLTGAKLDSGRYVIKNENAIQVVKKYAVNADLIFVDPPYDNADTGIKFVQKLAKFVRPGALVVQEIESGVDYSPDESVWNVLRDKTYGRARFVILQRNNNK